MRRMTYGLVMLAAFALAGSALVYAQAKAADIIVLKGAPMGAAKLTHAKHVATYGAKCTDCHHASKAQKPSKAANQKCTDCHTKIAEAPMTTKLQAAFHDPMAKKGLCVDCHVKATAAGKKTAPGKCADCHKKENG